MNQSTRHHCTRCESDKPVSEFGKNSRSPSGLKSWCRTCANDYERARIAGNPQALQARREAVQRWAKRNPERHREDTSRFYYRHRDDILASRKTPERLAKARITAARKRTSPEYRLAAAARSKAWRALNPDRQRENTRRVQAKRRAQLAMVTVIPFTPAQLEARLAYFGFRCWMCRAPYEHLDHVKPVKHGGPHMLSNLRPACQPCNRAKWAEWRGPTALHEFIR